MKENHKKLILMVNSKCDLKCNHCYISYKGERTAEETVDIANQLKRSGYDIIIAGSETLLNLDYLKAYYISNQDYILTNGKILLENQSVFNSLSSNSIKEIRVSYHYGIQSYLGSVSEDDVKQIVSRSKKKGFKVRLNTTIAKQNFNNVQEICKNAYDMGADGIFLIRYVKVGKEEKSKFLETLSNPEIESFFSLVDIVRQEYDKDKLEIRIHGNFGPKKGTIGEELSKQNKYCPGGEGLFVITPDDNIYECPFLIETPIGRLTKCFGIEINKKNIGKRDTCMAGLG